MDFIDISVPLSEATAVYPGDPIFKMNKLCDIPHDGFNLSEISMCLHTGTHCDAPFHTSDNAITADRLPLRHFFGKARVVDVSSKALPLSKLDLDEIGVAAGDIILLRTHKSADIGNGVLSEAAAEYLADTKILTIGVDRLSIDAADGSISIHRILSDAGIVIIECLDLSCADEGVYTLSAFPLKITGADGAPLRAVLIRE